MVHTHERLPTVPARRALRTLGVEEEFLLVDGATLQPVPAAEETLAAASRLPGVVVGPRRSPIAFHAELQREQVEVASPPVRTRSELVAVITEGRQAVDRAARSVGARALPVATAPDACAPHIASPARYQEIAARFGATAHEQLTCGMHIHVAVESPEEGVGVLDRVRAWLPVVLALSANSPFWHGGDTGFASYRYQAWGRWPTAGPTEIFGSLDAYRREVADAVASGVCLDSGMIYFDARLSDHAPTVEVRIADVCLLPEDAVTIPLLVRALVDRAAADWNAGIPPLDRSGTSLRLASWRASRWGLEGDLVHPIDLSLVPATAAVDALLGHVDEHYFTSVERSQVRDGVAAILTRGTGAALQRAAVRRDGDIRSAASEVLRRGTVTASTM
ncbi:glutamate--cysteine ligase [Microbacterium sp. 179-B 1A2 NHS]|uniref:glutamate--cysteine ligase n=1 Tax=Microbacterium sp. 179-B 1A2 NHS TaxID=3142383 RepID=UPI0039A30891